MRARLLIVALSLLPSLAFGENFTGKVVGVIDGDSIRVMHEKKAEQIRLSGIDCPEKGQSFGKRAKQATSSLAFGKEVSVQPSTTDRYGRTVATVGLPDGMNLNHELVKQGMCWWFKKYASKDQVLKGLEETARKQKLGLWGEPNPVPPWEFRKARAAERKALQQTTSNQFLSAMEPSALSGTSERQ